VDSSLKPNCASDRFNGKKLVDDLKIRDERGAEERRLGAIMFTDLVRYSAITHANEARGLRILDEHRQKLLTIFPRFKGRVVKTIGDAFLVEFSSAVEAVKCAVAVQQEMRKVNAPKEETAMVRLGLHVGDIVYRDGDIVGDAVNVAARVEPLAEPGEICVTRQVVDQVRNKTEFRFLKLGPRELKNIHTPFEIYKVMVPSEREQFGAKATLDRRRVAILPLANLSADPSDKYFADGMTEELISAVSNISELSVISRTSVMRYRDATVPIGEIGEDLRVGTVLEGSVRKAGNRVRIAAQLIEVESDRHLWSQSYDRDLTDVFAIQSDIAQRVAEALKVQLLSEERQIIARKSTDNLEAYTLYLKGRYYWNERTEEGTKKAVRYFEEAIRMDADFALAFSGLADCYNILSDYEWEKHSIALPKARDYATRALEIDDTLAEAHASLGLILLNLSWDFAGAERELKRAIELKPSYTTAYHWYSMALSPMGKFGEALEMEKRAIELDPLSRVIGMGLGTGLLYTGRTEQAIEQYRKTIELNPDFPAAHQWLGWAYALTSRYEEAIEETTRGVEMSGRSPATLEWLAGVYGTAGRKDEARKILEEIKAKSKSASLSLTTMAWVFFCIEETDEAFRLLEQALEERDPSLLYFRVWPSMEKYRSDPRWVSIERRMNLKIP